MLNNGGIWAALAGGWQLGGTFGYQPGSLIVFNNNLFYYGNVQNLLNYAAYNNPVTDPTNSNFGKVTTAVASAGAMRFFNFVMRFTF